MSISTSKMLDKLGRSVHGVDAARLEQDALYVVPHLDIPQLTPAPSPKKGNELDMKNVLVNALGLSSTKKNTPVK